MTKRDISQLTVYSIKEETETLPLECLRTLYLEKTSEIIYVTKEGKLYGIICMGEVLYGGRLNATVKINKSFIYLQGYNLIKAHEIFRENGRINKIPVVNEYGELIGDYSRWDDLLYIERNQELLMRAEIVKEVLLPYEAVYVAEPVDNEHPDYLSLLEYLNRFGIKYLILSKNQIGEILSSEVILICLDEDERRGIQCLYGITPQEYDMRDENEVFRYDIPLDERWKIRIATYKSVLVQLERKIWLDRLKIEIKEDLPFKRIDDKGTFLLSKLKERAVNCFCLYPVESEKTVYKEKFYNDLNKKLQSVSGDQRDSRNVDQEGFYGELCQIEEYKSGAAQDEIYDGVYRFGYEKDVSGSYFNVKNGRRITLFQPEEYIGTIYLLGPCVVVGPYVEDQYTVATYLQKKLLEEGYAYRVENYGEMLRCDADIDSRLEEIEHYHANDIIIYFSRIGRIVNVPGVSLEKIYEENDVPCEWVTDDFLHCNHKVNQLIANDILKMIKPSLLAGSVENSAQKLKVDIYDFMKEFIERKYLKQYFSDFSGLKYDTVGAIVMNCNPFSKGHRYLIQQAKSQVDILIVFVVEEDESIFPFEERFKLVKEGVKDIENVIVVPSGEFILSKNNFCEYFSKKEDKTLECNAEYDIEIFADYIAKILHITHRFAGEEPEDRVTRIYNEAMRKILPLKGISFIEIPRLVQENEIVSATKVRQYLKDEEYDKAFYMLPETTVQYLKNQM